MNKKKVTRVLALLLILALALSTLTGCAGSRPAASGSTEASAAAEQKTITFVVHHGDGSEQVVTLSTSAKTLREALESEGLIAGDESEYGLYVKTVDGETVDEGNQEWWCLTKGWEDVFTGVDGVEIADGDSYEFTFTVGW